MIPSTYQQSNNRQTTINNPTIKSANNNQLLNNPTIIPHFADQNQGLRSAINADRERSFTLYSIQTTARTKAHSNSNQTHHADKGRKINNNVKKSVLSEPRRARPSTLAVLPKRTQLPTDKLLRTPTSCRIDELEP
jgi:hypothetical protein